jgi:hypothetical protein
MRVAGSYIDRMHVRYLKGPEKASFRFVRQCEGCETLCTPFLGRRETDGVCECCLAHHRTRTARMHSHRTLCSVEDFFEMIQRRKEKRYESAG